MECKLHRKDLTGKSIVNQFVVDGENFAWCLENTDRRIAVGKYQIKFTESARFRQLRKCEQPPIMLEILGVPNRAGLRFHSANEWSELDGCLALGYNTNGETISDSRKAIEEFELRAFNALRKGQSVTIEITE